MTMVGVGECVWPFWRTATWREKEGDVEEAGNQTMLRDLFFFPCPRGKRVLFIMFLLQFKERKEEEIKAKHPLFSFPS